MARCRLTPCSSFERRHISRCLRRRAPAGQDKKKRCHMQRHRNFSLFRLDRTAPPLRASARSQPKHWQSTTPLMIIPLIVFYPPALRSIPPAGKIPSTPFHAVGVVAAGSRRASPESHQSMPRQTAHRIEVGLRRAGVLSSRPGSASGKPRASSSRWALTC